MTLTEILSGRIENGKPFEIRVTPRASVNRVKVEPETPGLPQIRVYVTVVPEDGRANAAVIKLLSKELRIPKSRFEILRGHTGRTKTLRILP